MTIEEEIFKQWRLDVTKLIFYGFKQIGKVYVYSKKILNNSFEVNIEIDNAGKVNGKIIELELNEEYNNYRVANITGEFVNQVKNEFINVLKDIRNNCYTRKYFISRQANSITDLMWKKYNIRPEFIWDKFPGYGIFRHISNHKWYALIMNINKGKIAIGNENVEVINVKLNENKIKTLLLRKGYYKAYHMNKGNWISIILDDTLADSEIMNCIIESYQLTR